MSRSFQQSLGVSEAGSSELRGDVMQRFKRSGGDAAAFGESEGPGTLPPCMKYCLHHFESRMPILIATIQCSQSIERACINVIHWC